VESFGSVLCCCSAGDLYGNYRLAAEYLMPNGESKNWIRLLAAIDGFRSRYGRWPTGAILSASILEHFRHVFTEEEWARFNSKLQVRESDDFSVIVEDDAGGQYDYREEGFPKEYADQRAEDWLGIDPNFCD
jgi:hypothetical protein